MPIYTYAASSRIFYNNQDLFLNGANLAWQYFADDIGPSTYSPDIAYFDDVFSQFQANGGNCMRLWLHTTGANSPAWSGYTVTGPGTNTIADLQAILDDAWSHNVSVMCCLWSFDMMRTSNGTTITNRSNAILSNPTYRQTYIDNCLIPMVTALKGHPAIVAWEIFNEPEGMSNEFGWSNIQHTSMANIQAFVNQCAGAIHRTDPSVLVTNGCWDMQAGTDVDGHTNYYRDDRLIAAGGDADGILDFYCIHYYDWAGTEHSPFLHDASYWELDKPLVIAEFYPNCDSTYCTDTPYETLYQRGYAGALGWSWTDVSPSLLLAQMNAVWMEVSGIEQTIALTVTKCKIAAGKTQYANDGDYNDMKDIFVASGTLALSPLALSSVTHIDVNIISADGNSIFFETDPFNSTTDVKKGKYTHKYKIPKGNPTEGAITSMTIDFTKKTFAVTVKNADLTGLGCPLRLEITMGNYTLSGDVGETVVNGKKTLIPTRLMRLYKDTLVVNKAKAKHSTKASSDSLSVKGEIAVADMDLATGEPNLVTEDVVLTWGDQNGTPTKTLTIPGNDNPALGSFKASKKGHVYKCSKIHPAEDPNSSIAAQFDLDKCVFTVSVSKADSVFVGSGPADSNDPNFSVSFDTPNGEFSRAVDVNRVTGRSY
jgi:hypothetical protein